MNKKTFLILFFLFFSCSLFAGKPHVAEVSGKTGNLESSAVITNKNLTETELIDNAVVLWSFSNTSASGNETGLSDTGQAGDLSLTQAGGVSGAVDTSPPNPSLDDGFYRNMDNSDDKFTANQVFLGSSVGNFTLETVVRFDTVSDANYIYCHTVSSSPDGIFFGFTTGNQIQFFLSGGGATLGSVNLSGYTIQAGRFYHTGIMRKANVYHVWVADVLTDGYVESASDFAALPAAQKTSFTSSGSWTPSNNAVFGDPSGAAGLMDGEHDWTRITYFDRY